MKNSKDYYETMRTRNDRYATTGIRSIDALIPKMTSRDLVIIGGEDCVGKSALAFQIAAHAASDENFRVLYLTAGMDSVDLIRRELPAAWRYEQGDRDEVALKQKAQANTLPVFFIGYAGEPMATLFGDLENTIRTTKANMLVIDSVQGIAQAMSGRSNVDWDVENIVRYMKALAFSTGVIVVIVSHLSRPVNMTLSVSEEKNCSGNHRSMAALADMILFIEPANRYLNAGCGRKKAIYQIIRIDEAKNHRTGAVKVIFRSGDDLGLRFEDC